jgi:hypothetical protein
MGRRRMGEIIGPFPQETWNFLNSLIVGRRNMLEDPKRYATQLKWIAETKEDWIKKYS